jgi:hypothetical protein
MARVVGNVQYSCSATWQIYMMQNQRQIVGGMTRVVAPGPQKTETKFIHFTQTLASLKSR